jgi:hypothetical protein
MRLNARCAHHVRPPVSQEAAIHEGLLREFERNKDDARFVLGQMRGRTRMATRYMRRWRSNRKGSPR